MPANAAPVVAEGKVPVAEDRDLTLEFARRCGVSSRLIRVKSLYGGGVKRLRVYVMKAVEVLGGGVRYVEASSHFVQVRGGEIISADPPFPKE